MADDPRLGLFLGQWERDQRDGVTLRSVKNRLDGHLQRYDADRTDARDRLAKLEARVETESRRDAEDRANGSGPHMFPREIPTPATPFAPGYPSPPGMQINIGQPIVATAGAPRKSGWWNKPVFNSTLKHTTIVIVTMILTSAVHWINDKTSQESRAAAVPLPPAATILDASAPIAGTISPVVTLAPIAEPAPSASGRPVRRAP